MKLLAVLLLLNVSISYAQEICLDASEGSVMSLSEDVIQADHHLHLKELKKWYKKKVTKEEAEMSMFSTRHVVDMNQPNCDTKNFVGIQFQYCAYGSPNAKMIDKSDIPLKEGDKKSNNKFLAQVFSKKDGTIDLVQKVKVPGAYGGKEIYVVQKTLKNGERFIYKIDPLLNAGYNPVEIINANKNKLEYVQLQPTGFSSGMSISSGRFF